MAQTAPRMPPMDLTPLQVLHGRFASSSHSSARYATNVIPGSAYQQVPITPFHHALPAMNRCTDAGHCSKTNHPGFYYANQCFIALTAYPPAYTSADDRGIADAATEQPHDSLAALSSYTVFSCSSPNTHQHNVAVTFASYLHGT